MTKKKTWASVSQLRLSPWSARLFACAGAIRRAGVRAVEPPPYQMRGTSRERAETVFRRAGLVPADAERVGDLILAESGPMQLHLVIRTGAEPAAAYVHAHAGLGRVVLMPGPIFLPVLGIWRAE
jgi:lipoprotein Spr